jgi:hypothetical protein
LIGGRATSSCSTAALESAPPTRIDDDFRADVATASARFSLDIKCRVIAVRINYESTRVTQIAGQD